MSIFDQRGQQVTYQYNAAGTINFGAVDNRATAIQQLEALQAEVRRAQTANALDESTATDVDYQLTKAVQQARKPEPDKPTILEHLQAAKALVEQVAVAGGIVTALVQAIGVIQKLF